jgi:hypothetical protein
MTPTATPALAPVLAPVLARGSHDSPVQGGCLMEYVSLLAGEDWSDTPSCTHPVLASLAQSVNDLLGESARQRLVPLIGALYGTAETGTVAERKTFSVLLAIWCGRQVLPLVDEPDRGACEEALDTAQAWTEGRACAHDCDTVANTIIDLHEANAINAIYSVARCVVNTGNAADQAIDRSVAAAADATHAAAGADALVGLLSGLIDEYDRLTGRTAHRVLTEADYAMLAAAVG